MAGYSRRPSARHERLFRERQRRLRTSRPLNENVPVLGWHLEGEISTDRVLGPTLVRIDPFKPEHKKVTGFNAWLQTGGPVVLLWQSNYEELTEHTINAGPDNEVLLDTPLDIENAEYGGEFLRPVIMEATSPGPPLCLFFYVSVTPI